MDLCPSLQKLKIDCTYLKITDIDKIPAQIRSLDLQSVDELITCPNFFQKLSGVSTLKVLKITALDTKEFLVDFSEFNSFFKSHSLFKLELHRINIKDKFSNAELLLPEDLKVLKVLNLRISHLPETIEKIQIRKEKRNLDFFGLNHRTIVDIASKCPLLKSLTI